MSINAKNQLLELLQDLGCLKDCANFQTISSLSPANSQHSTVVIVKFPDGRIVQGIGTGQRKVNADIAAAQEVIDILHLHHSDLLIDWAEIQVEAQAGDALIKLGVYLSAALVGAANKSKTLQSLESDHHLATVFDRWKAQGDPDLAIWGNHLGEKKKATLVEALLWRRFGRQVVTDNAPLQLQSLLKILH